ncbi:hypothetical protein DL96DRAFT_1712840 [Flagelloscypha sp. PMI_526]|nr:hypothetical protein DL96DRAFT_1712840 [Flagelloscypha sp. PMI_526]
MSLYEVVLPADEDPDTVVNSYIQLCSLIVLYWDHIVTFSDEVQYIWGLTSFGAICFYINRYVAFLANIPQFFINFQNHIPFEKCIQLSRYHQTLIIITQAYVAALLAVRVYALYGATRAMAWWFIVSGALLVGASIIVTFLPTPGSKTSFHDCPSPALSQAKAKLIAVPWLLLVLWDTVVFIMTCRKSFQTIQSLGLRSTVSLPLVDLVVRDGALYFRADACFPLNTHFSKIGRPRLRGCLSTLASSISVSLMSRLMINLHQRAQGILASAKRPPTTEGETQHLEGATTVYRTNPVNTTILTSDENYQLDTFGTTTTSL